MKIKLIDFNGPAPVRAHDNDAGADVFSPRDQTIYPGQVYKLPLGFGLELPDGYVGYIFPRSSLSARGKVYGADFTAAERKAMNLEIQRQLAEYSRKHANEIDAIILWQLHAQYGFGEKRLRRFYDRFKAEYFDLIKRYEMDEDDNIWLNTYKLKEIGVDIESWNRDGETE